ncbi:MAG TPA: M20/M25/M40 family metallo-hydrolase [Candidatus Eisenbacteria bacterium]|nr:M20/M25/M40 family metallo-hydrolase [Candidatus Eisenbacteria bacterium]
MSLSLRRTLWIGLLLLASPSAAELDRAERQMLQAIDRRTPASLALLERAVNINSGSMNFDGVRKVAQLFEPEFKSLGFKVRWADGASFGRAGHLIAERDGRRGSPKVLLIGHLDTVFEPDSPFQKFVKLDDSTARGPGIIDMKGGDVIVLLALGALADAGVLDQLSVRVVFTGDEEKSGTPLSLARRDLLQAADWADIAIGFEDGAGDPRSAVIARRGTASWTLQTSGRPSHSGQIFRPDVGSGAIYEAARILTAFHDSLAGERYLTFNPGLILGGTTIGVQDDGSRGMAFGKNNVVAESTTVRGDLRTLTLEQRARAQRTMQRIVSRNLPRTDARITFEEGYPPLAPSPGNRRLLAMYDEASRDLGLGPVEEVDPSRAGAADVSFTEGRVEMAIDGIGLRGAGGHTVQEAADLNTLRTQAQRAAVMLMRLAKAKRAS